jgi:carbamoyltransferase
MNVLGLHFGHDAAVAVIRDGQIASYVLRERHRRVKHAMTLQWANVEAALAEAGVKADDIDHCAITSTQSIELIIDEPQRLAIQLQPHPRDRTPCSFTQLLRGRGGSPQGTRSLLQIVYGSDRQSIQYRYYSRFFPEHRDRQASDFTTVEWIDDYVVHPGWTGMTLQDIGRIDASALLREDLLRHGFHYPATVILDERPVPASFVNHHAAHAASSFYQSGFGEAAVLTHDGFANGVGYHSGLTFYGQDRRIYPLSPHHLALGVLYDSVGLALELGPIGAAGKLMGLAAYGSPRFYDRSFAGNWYDWEWRGRGIRQWVAHCGAVAQEMGYDMRPLAIRSQMTEPINIDIAASTQKLFEETYLRAVESLHALLLHSGRPVANLCLSGGCALNCPSNTRVAREGPFAHVFVEPGCDDSGLAIGAALWLYHNVMDRPLPTPTCSGHATPYRGVEILPSHIEQALTQFADRIEVTPCDNPALWAAQDLANDRVIAWYEGRSEIGPRALGHRSILADPRNANNWPRVNTIKGREWWRPFAPAVLASQAHHWFGGLPLPSPYMLFNAAVRSTQIPAVTHADNSSRIQTVDPSCGRFFDLLEAFFARTGVPVLLNTSFNGPGQPIVESPAHALGFLLNSSLDALYLPAYRVTRRHEAMADPGRC